MNKTGIEWVLSPDGTPGYTWNPITGCLNGCSYCYARKLANTRLKDHYLANTNIADECIEYRCHVPAPLTDPFYPRFWPEKLKQSVGRRPKGVFVCDMSDLFGIGVPEKWTRAVLEKIALPWYRYDRFYLLTKQPQNMARFSPFPDNCWMGTTLTGLEQDFYQRVKRLQETEAKVKFISFEPLLTCIGLPNRWPTEFLFADGINWVIIGQQTPVRPETTPKIEWVRELVEAADKAGIPVFLKDNLNPMIQNAGFSRASWAATEWVQCKYPVLRQDMPGRARGTGYGRMN